MATSAANETSVESLARPEQFQEEDTENNAAPSESDLDEAAQEEQNEKLRREQEARAQALTLEIVGDLPYAEVKPPENVLFVCKLNPVTEDEDLDLIFSRFGKIVSCEVIRDKRTGDSLQYAFIEFEDQKACEQAYFKMQGVLIDDHRIHVDFSQSVSRLSDNWRTVTNSKRAKQAGGFGGVASLEKKRQYRAVDEEKDRRRRDSSGAVPKMNGGWDPTNDEILVIIPEVEVHDEESMGRIAGRHREMDSEEGSVVEIDTQGITIAMIMAEDIDEVPALLGAGHRTACRAMAATFNNLLDKLHLTSKEDESPPAQEPTKEDFEELKHKYVNAGQGQVFAFYDELSTAEKAALVERLKSFDPDHINELAEKALHPPKSSNDSQEFNLEPLPDTATASILDSKDEDIQSWYTSGLELVSKGQVAVVLMAGGQGTRLGSSAPKGCFNIGLPSQKSLFQMQAERIWKVQQLAEKESGKKDLVIPWYVMTSGPTRRPTEQFFEEHNYFGLQKDTVSIFEQGVLPCISNEGKILMESKAKVAVAPDGNGGIYQALLTSNVRTDMRKRGIQHIHAYCVDNCLVKVADPVFIGFAASKDVDIATKVVRKRNAKESVGLILQKNGKPDVVEYSEIDNATAEAKDPNHPDLLKFRAANIVNHYYSFRFFESIEDWAHKLPHHVARKKIPYVDTEKGETVKPDKPNGIKLEQFVFDVFPLLSLDKFACMEVKREDEFSPLKNAKGTGEDDPDTSKQDILNQGRRWVEHVGGNVESEVPAEETGVEVSPLVSYGGEGLEFLQTRTIKAPAVIEKEE
ncbi:MAG: hypothetical protein Q9218_006590 [Villophora microphyllina]